MATARSRTEEESSSGFERMTSKSYHYYFTRLNDQLACILKTKDGSEMATDFFDSMMATLKVLTVNPACKMSWTVDPGRITFNLENIQTQKSFRVLTNFIERLQDLGVLELHENPDALWFYSNSKGDQILNKKNYPPTVTEFLKNEYDVVDRLIKQSPKKYNLLVEVGCGLNMVNLPLATANKAKYLGLEVSPTAVRTAKEKICWDPDKYENVDVKCVNVLHIKAEDLDLKPDDVPLVFFPFNLLGNIAPVSLLLMRLRELGADVVVSAYKTDDATREMRRNYYENCNYNFVTEKKHETGSYFCAKEGLYTVAYEHDYLKDLFSAFGYKAEVIDAGKYGIILHAKPQPFLDLQPEPVKVAPIVARVRPSNPVHANETSYSLKFRAIMSVLFAWSFYKVVSDIYEGKTPNSTEASFATLGLLAAANHFGLFKRAEPAVLQNGPAARPAIELARR